MDCVYHTNDCHSHESGNPNAALDARLCGHDGLCMAPADSNSILHGLVGCYHSVATALFVLLGVFFLAGCGPPPDQAQGSETPTIAANSAPTGRVIRVASPSAHPGPTWTPTPTLTPLPTLIPTPSPLSWLLAYDSDAGGNDEIYLVPADGGPAVNVSNHPAEDRRPAWSPDGRRIAFQSNRDGNWEIYTLELEDGRLTRLTVDPAYDGGPAWSPDGVWIVFESYRDTFPCADGLACPDLELYRLPADGGTPRRLTESPGGDYQPAWSPDGRYLAFTSWRDGDKEVYWMDAAGGPAHNLTGSPGDDHSPVWSPDGAELAFISERDGTPELYRQPLAGGAAVRLTVDELPEERPTWSADGFLLFARYDPGPPFEAYDPYRLGAYHLYRLSPASGLPQHLLPAVRARHPAVSPLAHLGGLATSGAKVLARPSPPAVVPSLEFTRLEEVNAPDPRLVQGVDQAFRAWRAAVLAQSGYDYLGRLSDVYRPAGYYGHRLGYLSWHKTGRAVDLLFDWHDEAGQNGLYVVRENVAGEVYWRLWLKCAVQDGSLGEPLFQAPWHFWWHLDPGTAPEAVAAGGRRLPIPPGYFVDVTTLAERYGWSRIASYRLDDFHWLHDSTATEYWHYQHVDGLTWYQAMAQVYPPELLQELFNRELAGGREQTEAVMDGKGLPTSAPLDASE